MWESLLAMKNGSIFRIEPSPAWDDPDPFSLRGKDLKEYFEKLKKTVKGGGLTDADLAPIKEAFELEAERREKSEDIYDHSEVLPYDTLQDHPGMMKHTDVPAAPADRLAYMGDSNQYFMDFIPEDHPKVAFINQCIQMLNRDWDTIDEGYVGWYKEFLNSHCPSNDIRKAFSWLADKICEGKTDPTTLTEQALSYLDDVCFRRYHKKAKEVLANDQVYCLIMKNKKEWEKAATRGMNVYPEIKRFGQLLFSNFKDKMKGHHWDLYRKIKKNYAARVVVRGVDINRCDRAGLTWIFGLNARKVMTMRPFNSLQQVRNLGLLDRSVFADDEAADTFLEEMEKKFKEAKETMSLKNLAVYRESLLSAQKDKKYGAINWSPIWSYYAMLRNDLQKSMEESRCKQNAVTTAS